MKIGEIILMGLLSLTLTIFLTLICCMEETSNERSNSQAVSNQNKIEFTWISNEYVPQKIAQNLLTKNFYIVLDSSGSMAENQCSDSISKSEAAKKAIKEFVTIVEESDNLGAAVFIDDRLKELAPLGNGNRQVLVRNVFSTNPSGGTPLGKAVRFGYEKLQSQAQKQLGYGEYHLVIVTDGEADYGDDPEDEVTKINLDSPVIIHTIGFCISQRHSLNQPGRTYYRAANSFEQLRQGLQSVLAEAPEYDSSAFIQSAVTTQ